VRARGDGDLRRTNETVAATADAESILRTANYVTHLVSSAPKSGSNFQIASHLSSAPPDLLLFPVRDLRIGCERTRGT